MVENNCVIVTGNSLLQAFDRLEVLEATAHSLINASALGEVDRISDEEVEDLKKAFHLVD
jgi:L-fuculose-phosphate aldolase